MHWWVGTFPGIWHGGLCVAGRNGGEEGEIKLHCVREAPVWVEILGVQGVYEAENLRVRRSGEGMEVCLISSGFPGGMEEMACAFLMQVTEMKDTDVSLRTSPLLTFHE